MRMAAAKQSFLVLDMPPDDGGLELIERLLRAAPETRVVWTQAGRILNLNTLPGYGHGLLRAAEPEARGPLLHPDPGSAHFRCNHSTEKPPLRPGRGVLPRMAGFARSARGPFHRRERFLPGQSGDLYERERSFFGKKSSEKSARPPESSSPTKTHGGFW